VSRHYGKLVFIKTGKNHIYTQYLITHASTGIKLANAYKFVGKRGYWTVAPLGFSGSISGLANMEHVHRFIDNHVYPLRLQAPRMETTHSEYSEDGVTWSKTRTDTSKYFRMVEIGLPFELKVES
jgi:hypothetical protein